MQTVTTDVLVIGGGATGAGCLRDLAMRGIRAILVEKGDLTHGTTGRYHGLLHSGGRYVVKDPQSAEECARENLVLRRIMPQCIEDTGGFFVATPWDDPAYGDRFLEGCRRAGVVCQEISVAEALRREPALNPRISRVFEVNDAAADSFLATDLNVDSARQYGGQAFPYHAVTDLIRVGDRVVGALVQDLSTGETKRIEAAFVLNAAGAWAGKIAAMAGVKVTVVPGKGVMIAMNHRMVDTVINRCKLPADGDIIVPAHTVAVIGTTDRSVPDPDVYGIDPDEVALMLEEGEKLVPGFSRYRALRAWAGVRPLYKDKDVADDRDISRTYKLLDHSTRDGVEGFVSIVGGKWTTYRLMAQEAVDELARKLGNTQPCRTHEEPLPGAVAGRFHWKGERLAHVEAEDSYGDLICECELVTRPQVVESIACGAANIDDIRRDTRLGMGPCQGGFCTYRAVALWEETRGQGAGGRGRQGDGTWQAANSGRANLPSPPPSHRSPTVDLQALAVSGALLRHFLQERWKGLTAVLWGDQLRQARLDEIIFIDTLGVDLLPREGENSAAGPGLVTQHELIATEYHEAGG
jgi:glycerol-3-phosphate dehydrogenase